MSSTQKTPPRSIPRPRPARGIGRLVGGALTLLLIVGVAAAGFLLTHQSANSPITNANPVGDSALSITRTPIPITPTDTPVPLLPTPIPITDVPTGWQNAIQQALVAPVTPQSVQPVAPTSAPIDTSADGSNAAGFVVPATISTLARPDQLTFSAPTAASSPIPLNVVSGVNSARLNQWSLPPQQVPISRDPRDHFYFRRPVDSNANSTSLFSYPYGSMGPDNAWRVHHGIDLPNPDGQPVRAAAAGTVVWAADHYRWVEDQAVVDAAESYGNVVIIAHNFGYGGQQLYTLYAHLSKILVTQNQTVSAGDVIGLSGHSGQVTGPHVHFEVREGDNLYFDTRNPLLWMAPLVGRGVIAGRLLQQNGRPVENATVTLLKDNKQIDQTSTYVYPNSPGVKTHQVDGDDQWHESFVFGDVPVGTYLVQIAVNGLTLQHYVSVQEGTTSLIDFGYLASP